MRLHEAALLASLLGVDVQAIMAHVGIAAWRPQHRTVPLFGWADGNGEVHPVPPDEEAVPIPPEVPDDAIAVRVRTHEGPFLPIDGWVYFCAPPGPPSSDIIGRYAVARIRNGVTLLRFIRRGYRPGTYHLFTPMAAVSIDNADLEWAAPVILIRPA